MASSSSSHIDSLMEERKDFMISPKTNVKTFRKAHFLNPSATSPNESVTRPPVTNSQAGLAISGSYKLRLKGWGTPKLDWKQWVNTTANQQKNIWTQAGVYDAVTNSTYKIQQNNRLLFWLAERWSPETNTFVFSWGEASVTLEDVLILGCFSVLGDPVFDPPMNQDTEDICMQLNLAREELARSSAHKATHALWMEKFKRTRSEIEPIACLVYWLSRFVFPSPVSGGIINEDVIRAAVHLHKGNKIALAPAVLAGLYTDLSRLKEAIRADPQLTINREKSCSVKLSSPLKLVQVWAWERFPILQPVPKSIDLHEPIMARWDGLNKTNIEDILPSLNSPMSNFIWRPYITLSYALSHRLYPDREQYWVPIDEELDEDREVLIRCVRVSELVSLKTGNIKKYLPHRVAMQFGLDQDIPGIVERDCATSVSAWMNYSRPLGNEEFYLPSRHSRPSVTKRYWSWWKASDVAKNKCGGKYLYVHLLK